MDIIDAHVHVFPEKIAAAAVAATNRFYAGVRSDQVSAPEEFTVYPGTPADLAARDAAAGIARSVVFSTATAARQVESINSFIAGCCREYPSFIGVGTMHIDYPDFESEVKRIKALGLVGIKLHPDIQRFALDDPRLLPLYELMDSENLFLIAHTGDFRFDYSTPARMAHLAALFPRMRFVAAHFGGWSQWAEARECLVLPNVYVDTSSTIGFSQPDTAAKGFEVFDPTHIFFGSDYPMWEPGIELRRLMDLHLPDRLLEMVLSENFKQFLSTG